MGRFGQSSRRTGALWRIKSELGEGTQLNPEHSDGHADKSIGDFGNRQRRNGILEDDAE